MNNWIEKYKSLVVSSHKKHIVVADADNLFAYAELNNAFEKEGYTVIRVNSELEIRIQFELKVRSSEKPCIIVAPPSYSPLPDIDEKVNFKKIGLSHLFPNLDAKAINGLSFNALSMLSSIKLYEQLSYEKTLKFLLENLYNVDYETLTNNKSKERILNALITVFLEKNGVNKPLIQFLGNISKPYFQDLNTVNLNKTVLIEYIQKQWNNFAGNFKSTIYFLEPLLLKSLGYLFAFNYLQPVKVSAEKYEAFPKSLRIGVYVNEDGDNDNELKSLIDYLKQELTNIEDIPQQWFKIIHLLANAKLKSIKTQNDTLVEQYDATENSINSRFQRFIDNTYNSLFSLSGVRTPVLVTRILEHIKAKPSNKKALIVIDGMNYWQWNILGREFSKKKISFSAGASLAYIPTITAWSRQAIFRGEKPDLSANNKKEAAFFESYWQKQGLLPYQIFFRRFSINAPLSTVSISDDVNIAGFVCNDLDDIMHGSVLGDQQLKFSTEQWIEKSKILKIIKELKDKGFQVFITSDHGNVEATGIKNLKIKDKVGTVSRGKRHLQFTNELMKKEFIQQNENIPFGEHGLSVFLKDKEAFSTENTKIITHGGSHFWEVIVPLIVVDGE